ncbi:MAG: flavin reductase family protein [Opitutales bacterium]
MQQDLRTLSPGAAYRLLAGLVVPRPIAWVTTQAADGTLNAAPYSFFNVMGANPPTVVFAPGNRGPDVAKDTAANVAQTREFVVNLVDEAHAKAMNVTAGDFPSDVSEVEVAGLGTEPSVVVKPPRIQNALAALECIEHQTLLVGGNRLVIGIVQYAHVRDGVLDPESFLVKVEDYPIIGRMQSPDYYTRTHERFQMPRLPGEAEAARQWMEQTELFD